MNDRVLFIRLSALGDIVITLPAIALLREIRPDLRIDWLVEDRFASLLAQVEGIDRVIVYPRRALSRPSWRLPFVALRHWRGLKAGDWDSAVDFQGNLKSGMQLRLAGADRKIGLDRHAAKEGAHRYANVRVPVPDGCHRAERALRLLAPFGAEIGSAFEGGAVAERLRPVFRRDPAADAAVAAALGSDPRPIALLHPGTSKFAAFKRWPAERFAALVDLWSRRGDRRIVVTHGPGEAELADAIRSFARSPVECVRPTMHGVAGLIALLRRSEIVVAADSGPLLLASALGRATVALFGPKDPAIYAPPFRRGRVARHAVPCSPCSLRACKDPICMSRIEPATVLAEADLALALV